MAGLGVRPPGFQQGVHRRRGQQQLPRQAGGEPRSHQFLLELLHEGRAVGARGELRPGQYGLQEG